MTERLFDSRTQVAYRSSLFLLAGERRAAASGEEEEFSKRGRLRWSDEAKWSEHAEPFNSAAPVGTARSPARSLFALVGFEVRIMVWKSGRCHQLAIDESAHPISTCVRIMYVLWMCRGHIWGDAAPAWAPIILLICWNQKSSGRGLIPGYFAFWIPDPPSLISACKSYRGIWRMSHCCAWAQGGKSLWLTTSEINPFILFFYDCFFCCICQIIVWFIYFFQSLVKRARKKTAVCFCFVFFPPDVKQS